MAESSIQREIMLALSRNGSTVWRNNTGQAWAGEATRILRAGPVNLYPGDVVIRNARPLHAGLCVGSSDLIAVTPVTVAAHHVGQCLGVFTAVEVKGDRGRVSEAQSNFLDHVAKCGGRSGVARSVADALMIIKGAADGAAR